MGASDIINIDTPNTTNFRTIETENHFLRIEMESKTNRFYSYRLSINVWGNYIELKQVYNYKIDSVSISSFLFSKSDSLVQDRSDNLVGYWSTQRVGVHRRGPLSACPGARGRRETGMNDAFVTGGHNS